MAKAKKKATISKVKNPAKIFKAKSAARKTKTKSPKKLPAKSKELSQLLAQATAARSIVNSIDPAYADRPLANVIYALHEEAKYFKRKFEEVQATAFELTRQNTDLRLAHSTATPVLNSSVVPDPKPTDPPVVSAATPNSPRPTPAQPVPEQSNEPTDPLDAAMKDAPLAIVPEDEDNEI